MDSKGQKGKVDWRWKGQKGVNARSSSGEKGGGKMGSGGAKGLAYTHKPHRKAPSNRTKLATQRFMSFDQTGSVGAKTSVDSWGDSEQRLMDRDALLHRFVCLQHARAMGSATNYRLVE